MSRQRALRFGVADVKGLRAATWKLWTGPIGGEPDVYLACRALGGVLKTSLHQSGKWHVSYSPSAYDQHVKGAAAKYSDRYIEKWPRPSEIFPGITLAYRIFTPWSGATIPVVESDTRNVIWIDCAPENKMTEIDVIITSPGKPVSGWPGKDSMKTNLIGSLNLTGGDIVWVVSHTAEMPDLSNLNGGRVQFFNCRSKEDLLKSDGLRIVVFGAMSDGSRYMYDCPVDASGLDQAS